MRRLQVYDEKDYRRIRFVDRQKEVNESFAIDLIAEQPVNEVDHRVISCDGGGGALGHPKVYINLPSSSKHLIIQVAMRVACDCTKEVLRTISSPTDLQAEGGC
ncbi:hypothetical protein STEG23_013767 [Scotinomys teguina]